MTAREFEDCIRDLKLRLSQLWDKYRSNTEDKEPTWLLSIDNDSAHTRAKLHELEIWLNSDRFEQSPLSPDLHKVVEHVHAYLCAAMLAWRRSMWPQKPNLQQCKAKLEELFYAVQPASIQADVDTLPYTYQAVIDNAGLYAPPPLR